jgi:peptidoglycan/LPS O-acetylase OafA/YrhL
VKYRPEIDGLRALAVVPVILFHAEFDLFSGGFVGVDIFFVISGYLITTIILEDIELKKFNIINFYERRARRILPPLFFIVLVTLVFSVIFLPPHALKNVGQSVFSISLFLSNFFFYIETDYFANTSKLAPLLHTWSLSIEEQFYILFPFVLLLIKSFSQFIKFVIILVILIFSLIASEWLVKIDSQFSFFMPFTRFWEIMTGSLLAISRGSWGRINSVFVKETLSLVGFVIILFCIFFYNKQTIFPGYNAIPPVLGTALLIMFAIKDSFISRLLAGKLLVSTGLISYSLYLSHHVVFALSRNVGVPIDGYGIKINLIIISVVIAIISYFLIEKPLRFLTLSSMKYLIFCGLFSVLLATLGYHLHKTNGLKEFKLSNLESNIATKIIDVETELKERELVKVKLLSSSLDKFTSDPKVKKVLILGDSKSEDLYVSLIRTYSGDKYQFRRMKLDNSKMQNPSGKFNNNLELEKIVDSQLFLDSNEIILAVTWKANHNSNVVEFVKYLVSQEKKVSIVSTANFNDLASLSYIVAKRKISKSDLNSFMFDNIRMDWRKQYFSLRTAIKNLSLEVKFLDKLEAFCNLKQKSCNLKNHKGWYMLDSGHLTISGFDHFGNFASAKWFPE